MSLYAIGDLHLSFGADKPMDVFGPEWENHTEKLREGFARLGGDDVCVLCGDLSWGMDLPGCLEDFRFVEALPGKKILLKGNHDYWWSTAAKMEKFFAANSLTTMSILHNNFFPYGDDAAVCGTRGWFYDLDTGGEHDRKIMAREVGRLEASLMAAGDREKYVFLHYPPKYGDYECRPILDLLVKYSVRACVSGHIHGRGRRLCFQGMYEGVEHISVPGDGILFIPAKIL